MIQGKPKWDHIDRTMQLIDGEEIQAIAHKHKERIDIGIPGDNGSGSKGIDSSVVRCPREENQ